MDLERELEKRMGERLRRLGCLYYKFVSPQNRGVPDRIVICPDGCLVFVELKRPGGRLAALQSVQQARLRRHGQLVAQVWDREEVDAFANWIAARHRGPCETVPPWRYEHEIPF